MNIIVDIIYIYIYIYINHVHGESHGEGTIVVCCEMRTFHFRGCHVIIDGRLFSIICHCSLVKGTLTHLRMKLWNRG